MNDQLKHLFYFLLVLFIGVQSSELLAQDVKYFLHATYIPGSAKDNIVDSEKSILALNSATNQYVMSNLLGVTGQTGKFTIINGSVLVLYKPGGSSFSHIFSIPDPAGFKLGGNELNIQYVPPTSKDKPVGIKLWKVGTKGSGAASETPSYKTPEECLEQVFNSARAGDLNKLGYLCDPQHRGDATTECICNISPSYRSAQCRSEISPDVFATMFRNGKINGKIEFNGLYATVPFLYGPNNEYTVKMQMVRRGQAWYLYKFIVTG